MTTILNAAQLHLGHDSEPPRVAHGRHGGDNGYIRIGDLSGYVAIHGTVGQLRALASLIMSAADQIDAEHQRAQMDPLPEAPPTECPECNGSITHWHGPGTASGWYCSACDPDVADMMLDEDAGQLREAHTPMDRSTLVAAQVDPLTVQPREHDVACAVCKVGTWNLSGNCDSHYEPPAQAAKIADQITTVTA